MATYVVSKIAIDVFVGIEYHAESVHHCEIIPLLCQKKNSI